MVFYPGSVYYKEFSNLWAYLNVNHTFSPGETYYYVFT